VFRELIVFLLSLLPSFEARYAIFVGLSMGLDITTCIIIAVLAVLTLSTMLVTAMDVLDRVLQGFAYSRYHVARKIHELYSRYVLNVRKRVSKYVERYGVLGLTIFVAVPLPATGIWTGALAAYLLGIDRRKAWIALVVGGMLSIIITSSMATIVE